MGVINNKKMQRFKSPIKTFDEFGIEIFEQEYLAQPEVVFLGGDHWIASFLPKVERLARFNHVGDVESIFEATRGFSSYQPLLVILDYDYQSSISIAKILKQLKSHLFFQVIQVATLANNQTQKSNSPLLRNPCQPVVTICESLDAKPLLKHSIKEFFIQSKVFAKTVSQLRRFDSLSDRESRVVRYVARGIPNKNICKLIGVSAKTVEKCRKDIYEKLGVATGAEVACLVTFKNHFRWPQAVPFPKESKVDQIP
jgi:DNA-binding NarL/FixJ family response regulator